MKVFFLLVERPKRIVVKPIQLIHSTGSPSLLQQPKSKN